MDVGLKSDILYGLFKTLIEETHAANTSDFSPDNSRNCEEEIENCKDFTHGKSVQGKIRNENFWSAPSGGLSMAPISCIKSNVGTIIERREDGEL